eukprot:757248-Rhodomonas_salina.1
MEDENEKVLRRLLRRRRMRWGVQMVPTCILKLFRSLLRGRARSKTSLDVTAERISSCEQRPGPESFGLL